MKIVEAKSWLDGHPQFQTESQWAYVMRMLTGYGAAIERAAEAAAIERCAKFMEARADEIAAAENCTANMMAMIYRDEAKSLRALLPKEES